MRCDQCKWFAASAVGATAPDENIHAAVVNVAVDAINASGLAASAVDSIVPKSENMHDVVVGAFNGNGLAASAVPKKENIHDANVNVAVDVINASCLAASAVGSIVAQSLALIILA